MSSVIFPRVLYTIIDNANVGGRRVIRRWMILVKINFGNVAVAVVSYFLT
eukprot:gnl/Chilomastix_caulleri/5873.p1 GENE.gnl/Chilomastix_caulleri/5873~~gnl/Chilomastix_caulleri/5873.p1  ORF type:complete len:50 (+),score=4.13 gnl/Chilomastix_caulleri/5873:128-277(+)